MKIFSEYIVAINYKNLHIPVVLPHAPPTQNAYNAHASLSGELRTQPDVNESRFSRFYHFCTSSFSMKLDVLQHKIRHITNNPFV